MEVINDLCCDWHRTKKSVLHSFDPDLMKNKVKSWLYLQLFFGQVNAVLGGWCTHKCCRLEAVRLRIDDVMSYLSTYDASHTGKDNASRSHRPILHFFVHQLK